MASDGLCLFIFLSYKSFALVMSVGRCTVRQVSGGLYYSVTLGGMGRLSRFKGQPDVAFACPSLGQTIPAGKGWPLLGTKLSMLISVPTKTDPHSSPSPPPQRNRHVEAGCSEHWAQPQPEAGDWGSLLANKLNPHIAPRGHHPDTPEQPWPFA